MEKNRLGLIIHKTLQQFYPNMRLPVSSYQIEDILDYIAQLQKIDTNDVPPTTRAVEVVNVLREDSIEICYEREKILELAPNREGEFYKVPKILSD